MYSFYFQYVKKNKNAELLQNTFYKCFALRLYFENAKSMLENITDKHMLKVVDSTPKDG